MDGEAQSREWLDNLDAHFRAHMDAYCASLVKIRSKDGALVYLTLNQAQMYLYRRLEMQKEQTGRVRAIILKARQLGMSTYIAARFYQNTTLNYGQRTYILTHEDKATQNLFQMAKRIHENMEDDYRPSATTDNANELDFGRIDSGYRIGTAKNIRGGGRSQTIQNIHGSEVAFWDHAETHFTGVMQAVPDMRNTEIILESTANGIGGTFYDQWVMAEKGDSDFIPIFLPWFWDYAYRRYDSPEFTKTIEESKYQELYDLDDAQMAWMHFKNIELGGHPGKICWQFRQEYPANSQEAFQTSGTDSLVKPELVLKARKYEAPDQSHLAKVLGVDIARGGGDKTRMIDRQGRKAGSRVNETIDSDDLMEVTGLVAREIDKHKFHMTFIDGTGLGSGVFDRLKELGYYNKIRLVHFGSNPIDKKNYFNKRAEMWGEMNDWFKDLGGADIPDDDHLHRHICGPGFKHDSNDRLVLEPKREIKTRLGFSPDGGDSLALTFAENVRRPQTQARDAYGNEKKQVSRDWMTI